MSSIFQQGIGGGRVTSSATSQANIIKGQASIEAQRTQEFSEKLKNAQKKAEELKTNSGKNAEDDRKLREVCQEMESVFLNLMVSKMRDTIPERTLFPKSSGEKMMQSMFDVELTKVMSKAGGIGIGELLYQQLSNPGTASIPSADNNVGVKKEKD